MFQVEKKGIFWRRYADISYRELLNAIDFLDEKWLCWLNKG